MRSISVSSVLKPLGVASAVAFGALGLLSRKYQRARLYFNTTIYLTTLGATSVWGLLVTILATAVGQRLNINYYVARSFYKVCHPLVGVEVEVEGEEHLEDLMTACDGKPQSAVVIANHQSMLDILFLGRIFPERTSIMAKKELKYAPLLGPYMQLSGAVFIDRKSRQSALRTVTKAGDDMKRRGVSLWIFPEGTRTLHSEPALLPFKKGAFHLAIQAQVPIVAIVCENYEHMFDGRTRFDGGKLKVKILPPISTKGLTVADVSTLTETTRDVMLQTLKDLSRRSPSADPKHAALTEGSLEPEVDVVRQQMASAGSTSEPLSLVTSHSETTEEDEMDDDAVLLQHPKTG